MIWIVKDERSYQAIGANVAVSNGKYSLWIERPTGASVKIIEGDKEEVEEYKEAIDFAVKSGERLFEIK